MTYTPKLLQSYPIISDQVDRQELEVLLSALEQQLQRQVTGSVVEFGCYIGTTSLFIRRMLNAYSYSGQFHVYDSFAGLPAKSSQDSSPAGEQFTAGALAVSKKDFSLQFKKASLQLPTIHKCWFEQLGRSDVPADIMFAFLDGDYYSSIRDSLRLITPNLASNATIIVDDYSSEALPGVARATDEWLKALPRARCRVEASLAIIDLPG